MEPEESMLWDGPAYYTNRIWVTFQGSIIRITFAEQGGPDIPPAFRVAVALTPADAVAFADVLENMVKDIRSGTRPDTDAPV